MENSCSFGIILNSNCISRRKNEQIDIDDLSLMEVELIKLRSVRLHEFVNTTKTSMFKIIQTISESAQVL